MSTGATTAPTIHMSTGCGPRFTVELSANASRDLEHELRRSFDNRESGGWLLGVASGRRISVCAATGPGPNSSRDIGFMTRSLAHGEARARARGLSVVGGWHSHPDGATALSDDGLSSCSDWFDALRTSDDDPDTTYVELIAARRRGEWKLTPYVLGAFHGSLLFCERAEIKR